MVCIITLVSLYMPIKVIHYDRPHQNVDRAVLWREFLMSSNGIIFFWKLKLCIKPGGCLSQKLSVHYRITQQLDQVRYSLSELLFSLYFHRLYVCNIKSLLLWCSTNLQVRGWTRSWLSSLAIFLLSICCEASTCECVLHFIQYFDIYDRC